MFQELNKNFNINNDRVLVMSYQNKSIMSDIDDTNLYLEKRIVDIFLSIGISAHLQGYQYLKESVKLIIKEPEYINSITKKMYPKIAEVFSTTACRVERGIRHAIDVAFSKGKIIQLNKIFGVEIFSQNDKPTNAEFVALIADKLSLETR